MLRPRNMPAMFASLLLLIAVPSESLILDLMPSNSREFENVFQYKATDTELSAIVNSLQKYPDLTTKVEGKSELYNILQFSVEPAVVIIGHNEDGMLRFGSGEVEPIVELSKRIEASGKIGVFLTCKGSCYTDAPANRSMTSLDRAIDVAEKISNRVGDYSLPSEISAQPKASLSASSAGIAEPTQNCITLMKSLPSSSTTMTIERDIRQIIRRSEVLGHLSIAGKVGGALTGAGVIYVLMDD